MLSQHYLKKPTTNKSKPQQKNGNKTQPLAPDRTEGVCAAFEGQQSPLDRGACCLGFKQQLDTSFQCQHRRLSGH